jgi:hypothetical protein
MSEQRSSKDLSKRLRASVSMDAINGDTHERAVCAKQMREAADEIERLRIIEKLYEESCEAAYARGGVLDGAHPSASKEQVSRPCPHGFNAWCQECGDLSGDRTPPTNEAAMQWLEYVANGRWPDTAHAKVLLAHIASLEDRCHGAEVGATMLRGRLDLASATITRLEGKIDEVRATHEPQPAASNELGRRVRNMADEYGHVADGAPSQLSVAEHATLVAAADELEKADLMRMGLQTLISAFKRRGVGTFASEVNAAETLLEATEPPYWIRSFWSPCRKYIATVHAYGAGDLVVQDDDGREWESTGPVENVTAQTPRRPAHNSAGSPHEPKARESLSAGFMECTAQPPLASSCEEPEPCVSHIALQSAERALMICAKYLANLNAGKTDGFNAACLAIERHFEVQAVGDLARATETKPAMRCPDETSEPQQEGRKVYCNDCDAVAVLPYTDDTRRFLSIASLDGWTAPPSRCPKCSTAQGERPCPDCGGDGKIEYGHPNAPEPERVETCKSCNGTGDAP